MSEPDDMRYPAGVSHADYERSQRWRDSGCCPKCGGELFQGYGLMGSGIGVYEGCSEDGCDYFSKEQDREEESP